MVSEEDEIAAGIRLEQRSYKLRRESTMKELVSFETFEEHVTYPTPIKQKRTDMRNHCLAAEGNTRPLERRIATPKALEKYCFHGHFHIDGSRY